MNSHCTYRLVIKEVPFCSRWQQTLRPTTSQDAGMSDCGVLSPKWDIISPPKAEDHCRNRLQRLSQRQWTTISKLFSRYSGAAKLHIWTHRDCDSMHEATHNFKPDKSQHGDGGILSTGCGTGCSEGQSCHVLFLRVWPLTGLIYSWMATNPRVKTLL